MSRFTLRAIAAAIAMSLVLADATRDDRSSARAATARAEPVVLTASDPAAQSEEPYLEGYTGLPYSEGAQSDGGYWYWLARQTARREDVAPVAAPHPTSRA